ncbi:MAG: type II toxin-antitoxin system VapC family toxin [Thiohalocapsa sp.]
MPAFMLDTNILSEAMRHPNGVAANRMRVFAAEICTSIIVAAEIRYGIAKSGWPRLIDRAEELLRTLPVVAFDSPADIAYGELRARLALAKVIGPNDLLIAAHAVALGITLVTDKERDFSHVPGLRIENWLR